MKYTGFATFLTLLFLSHGAVASANQLGSVTFNSRLHFSGAQWQVKSAVGPVYLARKEANAWKVLAVFDGTNGKYYLDWENPSGGEYAAVDGAGNRSESLSLNDDRAQRAALAYVPSLRSLTLPLSTVHLPEPSDLRAGPLAGNR